MKYFTKVFTIYCCDGSQATVYGVLGGSWLKIGWQRWLR